MKNEMENQRIDMLNLKVFISVEIALLFTLRKGLVASA